MTHSNNEKTVLFKLLPKQSTFLRSTKKEVLLSGAYGSSKSTALCLAILKECQIPNAQILLCRKTLTSLKRSTLGTLIHGKKPVLPNGSYKYNKSDGTIIMNGSNAKIFLMGLDEIEKVRSMNLSFVGVDEAIELTENEWLELMGRLRNEDGSRRIVGATNPGSPTHWLYNRFFVEQGDREVICSTTLDNPYLPKDYIESLKTLPEDLYNRFVLGEWRSLEGLIYPEWSQENIRKRDYGEFSSYLLGIDFGFTNPTAICLFGRDGDDNLHLIQEVKQNQLLISQIVSKCEPYHKLEPLVIVDPSAPALIAELQQNGFNVQKADNIVLDGISVTRDYIYKKKLTVDPSCVEFIKEIQNYIYDSNGKPVKVNDHLVDATRYTVVSVVGTKQAYESPSVYF